MHTSEIISKDCKFFFENVTEQKRTQKESEIEEIEHNHRNFETRIANNVQ